MERLNSNESEEQYLGSKELGEICSRLPAKAAIKVCSLSKPLIALLYDPSFVKKQSIRSSLFDCGFFLRPDLYQKFERSIEKLEFHVLPAPSSSSSRDGDGVEQPPSSIFGIASGTPPDLQRHHGRVLCSSQGLLLMCDEFHGPNSFLVINPARREAFMLDVPDIKPKRISERFRFRFDWLLLECHPINLLETDSSSSSANTDVIEPPAWDWEDDEVPWFYSADANYCDYTIIAPVYWYEDEDDRPWFSSTHEFAVYRNDDWETDTCHCKIEGRLLRMEMPVGVFRGHDNRLFVHYLCDSLPNLNGSPTHTEPYMVAYDVDRRAHSRTFGLPEDAWKVEEDGDVGSLSMKIFKWRRAVGEGGETVGLARTDQSMLRVWVLEDYDQGRWRRVVSNTTAEMGVPEEEGPLLEGCCLVKGTDCFVVNGTGLLFATKRRVYAYVMDGATARAEVVAEHGLQEFSRLAFIPYANTLRPVCGRINISYLI